MPKAVLGLAVISATAVACGAGEPLASEYVPGLVQDLRAAGVTAEELAGPNARLLFSVEGKSISANGGSVHVFAFPDTATATSEASYVSEDGWSMAVPLGGGSTSNAIYEWGATPHYYRKDEIIVVYVGDDEAVIGALVGMLGPQFAGG